MMDAHDIERLKRQTNIVDLIGQSLPLKKSGDNFTACCPFHSEKTPSFTVSESKQFYHCFGCGANGDVFEWLKEYSGLAFIDAVKYLGGEIEHAPIKKIAENERRVVTRAKLPPDHKEDPELANQIISKCESVNGYYRAPNGKIYLPLTDAHGEIKNLVYFEKYDKTTPRYIAGGPSYDCFCRIVKNNTPNYIVVNDLKLGSKIANKKGYNVAVSFTGAVMKYLCMWNRGDLNFIPLILPGDDDYLCYEVEWLSFDGQRIRKNEVIS